MRAPMSRPEVFYDLGSPYAYLAVERAERVLGVPPVLRPVLLGAIFAARGHGSWSHPAARAEGIAEVKRRAAAYGLPPVRWPPGDPAVVAAAAADAGLPVGARARRPRRPDPARGRAPALRRRPPRGGRLDGRQLKGPAPCGRPSEED